jgi:hypothetical protein
MSPRGIVQSDEEYARQLQEAYDTKARILSSSPSQQQQQQSAPTAPNLPPNIVREDAWSVGAVQTTSADSGEDEELVQQLQHQQQAEQQVQQDEQLASQLQLMEDQRTPPTVSTEGDRQPSTKPWIVKLQKVLCWSLIVGLVAVAAILLISFFSGKNIFGISSAGGNGGIILNIFDPYKGKGGTFPTSSWENSGNGLQLTVYNALTSDWYPFFTQALQNWAFGHTPTSLLLFTQQITPDSSCTAISSAVKVCNGNYGDTGWKGINEAMVTSNGWITQSSVRMNDYYLSSASDGEKLYTMCHETGHAWRLNHQGNA